MKKIFLLQVLFLLFTVSNYVYAYDFTVISPSGHTLQYTINSSTTVSVDGSSSSINGALIIPNSVTYNGHSFTVNTIGHEAFMGENITSVTIPDGITSIGDNAFKYCSGLTSVTIPNSVTTIGNNAFQNCNGLTSITIGNGVTSIGNNAFQNCNGLTSITIGNGVTSIGNNAFSGCTSLTSLIIPGNVSSIGSRAFYNCTGLTTVTIGIGVTSIGDEAFSNCTWLSSVFFNATNCYSAYSNTNPLFSGCFFLSKITFGNNVTRIPSYMCYGCSGLTQITIGASVTTIGSHAFSNCQNLNVVKTEWPNGPIISGSSYNNYLFFAGTQLNNATLIVPAGTRGLYINMVPWKSFGNIVVNSSCTITASSNDDNKGTVSGSGTFSTGDIDTLTATANYGYHFSKWSDNNTDNPRVLLCSQDDSLVAIFEPNDYILTCNNSIGGGVYPYLSLVQIHALPQGNMQFRGWSDSVVTNPRMITILSDTTFTALFSPLDTTFIHDTTLVYDSVYIEVFVHDTTYMDIPYAVHDTTYINVLVHDTTYIDNYIHDTTIVNNWVYDTTILWQYDTTYINNYIYDTTIVDNWIYDTTILFDTVTLTEYVPVHDTTYIDNYIYDTTIVDNWIYDTTYLWQYDTTYIDNYIHDTTYLWQYDTTYINNYIHDTTIVDNWIYDTTYLWQYDTTYINNYIHDTTIVDNWIHDTTYLWLYDTTYIDNYVYDTVTLTDTLWLTQYDTLWLHDTIIIHDTVYITEEGIDGVDALNAKVYSSEGRIVVEGADGNRVTLYDVTGRVLATKQDDYSPLHFEAPASGTYLIKIGAYPARRVVVIR